MPVGNSRRWLSPFRVAWLSLLRGLTQALVDQGFRGQEHHPEGVTIVITRFTAKVSVTMKQLFKRRNAIEPIIGHAQSDHGLARNYLRGTHGDKINALLVGCGFNLAKLLRFFAQAQPAWRCA